MGVFDIPTFPDHSPLNVSVGSFSYSYPSIIRKIKVRHYPFDFHALH